MKTNTEILRNFTLIKKTLLLSVFLLLGSTSLFAQTTSSSEYKLQYKFIKGGFSQNLQENIALCRKDKLCIGLVLPPGYFTLDKTVVVPSAFQISGAGVGKTRIALSPTFVGNAFSNNGTTTNISISDLSIDLKQFVSKSKTNGIYLKNVFDSNFKNLEIQNASSTGIIATQSSGLIFENVTVTNSGKDGIAFDRVSSSTIYKSNLSQNKGNGATLTSTSKVNFQNSTSTQNTNIGIFLNGTSTENVIFQSVIFGNGKAGISSSLSKGVGESKNSILENLISKNGDDGITLLLTNKLNIVSNTIKENKDHGVSIASSTAIVMSKNSILDNMNEAIVVGKGAEQIDILDNTILDSGFLLPLEKQGKSLGVNIGNGSTHILLSGNTIKNSTDVKYQNYGIKIGSLASYVFAKSNNVTDMGTSGVLVEGDWGTKCVYDDSVPMPRYQKLKCYFLSFFN